MFLGKLRMNLQLFGVLCLKQGLPMLLWLACSSPCRPGWPTVIILPLPFWCTITTGFVFVDYSVLFIVKNEQDQD